MLVFHFLLFRLLMSVSFTINKNDSGVFLFWKMQPRKYGQQTMKNYKTETYYKKLSESSNVLTRAFQNGCLWEKL